MTAQLVAGGVLPSQMVSLDNSEVVIDRMRHKYADSAGRWIVGDMTKLDEIFPPHSFDVVIDKCTIDAVTVDPGDIWGPLLRCPYSGCPVLQVCVCVCTDPNEATRSIVNAVVTSVRHVLKADGVFVSMSFNQPHFRKPLLSASGALSVSLHHHTELGFRDCFIWHLRVPTPLG